VAPRVIGRKTFTAADLEVRVAGSGLRLVGPARIAAEILNATVWHYAPMIVEATGKDVAQAKRAKAAAEKRIASATHRLRHVLHGETDAPSADLLRALTFREVHAEADLRQMKVLWGSANAGQHDRRDFLGGALPAAFVLIHGSGSVAQRDAFVHFVCTRVGLVGSPEAIKKAVVRFQAAKREGEACNLPDWMGT
jgi:hypothetical protein